MKKIINMFGALLILFVLVNMMSCQKTFTDERDGTKYKIVKIGQQEWMAENLRYLPEVSNKAVASMIEPLYYVYDYDAKNIETARQISNYKIFGTLYNWEAAKTACPKGWHLPTDAEYQILIDFLGGANIAAGKMKSNNTQLWTDMMTDTSNLSEFSAIPGGYHSNGVENYKFADKNSYAVFWTSTLDSTQTMASYKILFDNGMQGCDGVRSSMAPKDYAVSVRCIKN